MLPEFRVIIQRIRSVVSERLKLNDFSLICKWNSRVYLVQGTHSQTIAKVYAMRHVFRRGTCRSGTRNDRYLCIFNIQGRPKRESRVRALAKTDSSANFNKF